MRECMARAMRAYENLDSYVGLVYRQWARAAIDPGHPEARRDLSLFIAAAIQALLEYTAWSMEFTAIHEREEADRAIPYMDVEEELRAMGD